MFVRDEAPLESIERRLTAPGEGEVSLVVMLGPQDGEVEIRLPGRYSVSAAIAACSATNCSTGAGSGGTHASASTRSR